MREERGTLNQRLFSTTSPFTAGLPPPHLQATHSGSALVIAAQPASSAATTVTTTAPTTAMLPLPAAPPVSLAPPAPLAPPVPLAPPLPPIPGAPVSSVFSEVQEPSGTHPSTGSAIASSSSTNPEELSRLMQQTEFEVPRPHPRYRLGQGRNLQGPS
ncbi:hypothetical protein RSAG8_09720, partial [Rhizoctonia solani AG-8 WAC10335]